MQSLRGTGVALVTPFNEDMTIDLKGLENVIENAIAGAVEYLVVMGTTGENATLTADEKNKVIAHAIKINNNRIPLVLGVGGNSTAAVVKELQERDLTPFDAILSVSPYYNKPTQSGIYAHFKAVAQSTSLPIILYNVPGRTASNILPATTLKLATDFNNIIGIKEAAGDMVQVLELIKDRPEGFLIISGDDMIALPTVTAGGDGVISVIGQGMAAEFSTMIRDGLEGNIAKAYKNQYTLMPIIDLIFEEGNPVGIKSLLQHKGVCGDTVRLPLLPASTSLTKKIATYLSGQ